MRRMHDMGAPTIFELQYEANYRASDRASRSGFSSTASCVKQVDPCISSKNERLPGVSTARFSRSRDSPPDDDGVLSRDVNSCFLDELETAARSAWQEEAFQFPVGEPAGVLDMYSIDIFQRRNRIGDFA